MQRLCRRVQFECLLAQAPCARTRHFVLHHAAAGDGVLWLGAATPKRWARRAVTRNAIRRQIYASGCAQQPPLPAGMYLVRLRAAFAPQLFPSATSPALRRAVRAELHELWQRAAACIASQPPCAVS